MNFAHTIRLLESDLKKQQVLFDQDVSRVQNQTCSDRIDELNTAIAILQSHRRNESNEDHTEWDIWYNASAGPASELRNIVVLASNRDEASQRFRDIFPNNLLHSIVPNKQKSYDRAI